MHYVICYDLENDRLREKVGKLLTRHGCERVQKSVFFAANLDGKHLGRLKTSVARALERWQSTPRDSVLLIPLPDEYAWNTTALSGANNVLAAFAPPPAKVLL